MGVLLDFYYMRLVEGWQWWCISPGEVQIFASSQTTPTPQGGGSQRATPFPRTAWWLAHIRVSLGVSLFLAFVPMDAVSLFACLLQPRCATRGTFVSKWASCLISSAIWL